MNNFRLIGNRYISKDGDDANDGLTPDTPKATISAYSTTNIIGSGVYKGNFGFASSTSRSYLADGVVKIDATANMTVGQPAINASPVYFNNSLSGNYFFIELNGFAFNSQKNANANNACDYVVLNDGTVTNSGGGNTSLTFRKSVLVDITSFNSTTGCSILDSSVFNSLLTNMASTLTIRSSYFDEATILTRATIPNNFDSNNFRGILNIGGTQYQLKKDRNGVDIPSRVANGIADYADIDATVYDRGNFAQDPLFLNIDKRDYVSVAVSSPMVFSGFSGGNIANARESTAFKATDSEFSGGTITGLTTSAGDFILDGVSTGNVVSQAMQIAPIPQVINYINFAELLNFNSDEVIGTTENDNVTIVDNFAAATAGANPRRLTYEMRWSSKDTTPLVDTDWENQFYTTAGDFVKFEQFTKPLIDPSGTGNGDPAFTNSGAVGIKAKWVQFRITMRNGIG